jgi:hypothetical protein
VYGVCTDCGVQRKGQSEKEKTGTGGGLATGKYLGKQINHAYHVILEGLFSELFCVI